MMIENKHLNCMIMVICKVTTIANWGCRGAVFGVSVGIRGCRLSGVYWKTWRDSRYSGARRGIGASGGIGDS